MTRYCIIGAGAAGLSAIQQLRQAGYDVDCFEKSDRVGGHWHTDYEALHLITARDMTQFEDFPMPKRLPALPPPRPGPRLYRVLRPQERAVRHHPVQHGGYLRHTTASRGRHGLRRLEGHTPRASRHLRRRHRCQRPPLGPEGPAGPGRIRRQAGALRRIQQRQGHRRHPRPGGRSGNSGCDLAVDVAQHRLEADIVIRDGVYFQPKTYFGKPRQQLDFLAQFSPSEQDLIARLMARVSIGEWQTTPACPNRSIVPWPRAGPWSTTSCSTGSTTAALVSFPESHGSRAIQFTSRDGSAREYDTILWATGFHSSMPFLDDRLVPRRAGAPIRYAGGHPPQGLEKLFYVGMIAPRGPQLPIYGMQAKIVATG